MHWLFCVRVCELVLAQLACQGSCALTMWCSPRDAALKEAVHCGNNAGLAGTNSPAEQDVDGLDVQTLVYRVELEDLFLQGCGILQRNQSDFVKQVL